MKHYGYRGDARAERISYNLECLSIADLFALHNQFVYNLNGLRAELDSSITHQVRTEPSLGTYILETLTPEEREKIQDQIDETDFRISCIWKILHPTIRSLFETNWQKEDQDDKR